jgi:hypothetical protein
MQLAEDILQLLDGAVGAAEQALALGREGDGAMPAHQQPEAELVFQGLDLPADGRLGQAEVLRGERDAHAAAHRDEAAKQVQGGAGRGVQTFWKCM